MQHIFLYICLPCIFLLIKETEKLNKKLQRKIKRKKKQ